MCELADDEELEKFSVDSLECAENSREQLKPSAAVVDESPIRSCVPFRLHEEIRTGSGHPVEFDLNPGKGKISWNFEIDETVLTRKGLQLNEDGSFSKSPREGGSENLPFVMSAPRVALIRRRRRDGRKNPTEVAGRKSSETTRNLTGIARAANYAQELSRLKASGNLTDSMKEALYSKCKGPRLGNEVVVAAENFARWGKESKREGKQKGEESSKEPRKNCSDLRLPTIEKPTKLSYFERYQKKNGFDPRSISLKGEKTIEDTVRSKFGDSSRESLSDVSSRLTVVDDGEEEEEELFYRRMMNGEGVKTGNAGSEYSERSFGESGAKKPGERRKEVKIMKANPKRTGKGSPNHGAQPAGCTLSGRKSGHSCATDREPLPKAELASKARAYGNLANTRNIVKMQLKSFRRDWECPPLPEVGKSRTKCESFLPPLGDGRFTPRREIR